jgi:hypothetical protein
MIWMLDEAAAGRLRDLPEVKWAKEAGEAPSSGAPIHSGAV